MFRDTKKIYEDIFEEYKRLFPRTMALISFLCFLPVFIICELFSVAEDGLTSLTDTVWFGYMQKMAMRNHIKQLEAEEVTEGSVGNLTIYEPSKEGCLTLIEDKGQLTEIKNNKN